MSAVKSWEQRNIAFRYHLDYIKSKSAENRFDLDLFDLLLTTNFKGGNASILEEEDSLTLKLLMYTKKLKEINDKYDDVTLESITDLNDLITIAKGFIFLGTKESEKIYGMGASMNSALLAAYFPNLFPIIDMRVLWGARIGGVRFDSQGQVKNIGQHYGDLIKFFKNSIDEGNQDLRQLDKELFIDESFPKREVRKGKKISDLM